MKSDHPILLFDGICNLCNTSVNFILKRDKKKQFQFIPLQSDKGLEIMDKYKLPKETNSVILIKGDNFYIESEAIIEICRYLPIPWKWVPVFRIVPLKWRNILYKWIAKNRYQWFGKRESCRIV